MRGCPHTSLGRRLRNKRDRECCAAETAEQKEHRLNKCWTKDRARQAAHAAAEVVLRSYIPLNVRHQNRERSEECVYMPHAHAPPTQVKLHISAKAITNQID